MPRPQGTRQQAGGKRASHHAPAHAISSPSIPGSAVRSAALEAKSKSMCCCFPTCLVHRDAQNGATRQQDAFLHMRAGPTAKRLPRDTAILIPQHRMCWLLPWTSAAQLCIYAQPCLPRSSCVHVWKGMTPHPLENPQTAATCASRHNKPCLVKRAAQQAQHTSSPPSCCSTSADWLACHTCCLAGWLGRAQPQHSPHSNLHAHLHAQTAPLLVGDIKQGGRHTRVVDGLTTQMAVCLHAADRLRQ
jgi:hypothetical protein